MKKTIAILIAVLLMVSCLSLTAFAAEDSEMVPVVVKLPEGWETPNLWAWADDGTNAFAAWPGEAMEELAEGWYYTYVPSFVQNVIINANQGTNAFEAWPGEAMVEGEDGWFTGKAPTWINSLIINGNEGTVQTSDVSIEGKELWITVYEDLTYDLSYEDPNKAVPNITFYAQVPADWADPCCWAWSAPDGTNAFNAWPGEALTQNGDWYAIEVPGWINSVIINANEGTVQTTDLSVEAGKNVWVVVTDAENAAVYYEEPAAAPVETAPPETTAPAPETTAPPAQEPAEEGGNGGMIIGAVAAVALLGGGAAVVMKKKKK